MPTFTTTDPVTGEVTYTYTTYDDTRPSLVMTATDFDTADESQWASYTLNYGTYWPVTETYLRSAETKYDDGSSFTFENIFHLMQSGPPRDMGDRTITTDTQGRVDYVYETYVPGAFLGQPVPEATRALDYDPVTGHLDYAVTTLWNGRVVAQDFDAATGKLDYELVTNPDGSYVAKDVDLLDQYSWSTYTLVVGADGKVIDTIIA